MEQNKTVYLLPLVATLFWGGNFVAGRAVLEILPPFSLSFLRWAVALAFLLPFAWRDLARNAAFYRTQWKEIARLGFLGIAVFTPLVYLSIEHTTTINAAMLSASSPMMIVLVAFLMLGEKINSRQLAGFFLSLLGVLWIISKGSITRFEQFEWNAGDYIMLACNTIWALYAVRVRKTDPRLGQLGAFALSIVASLLFLLPGVVWEVHARNVDLFRIDTVWHVLYLGVFASAVSFLCWNKSVTLLGPAKVSPFLNFMPLFATLFSVLFLGERLQLAQAVGGLLILSGVYLSSLTKHPFKKADSQADSVAPQKAEA